MAIQDYYETNVPDQTIDVSSDNRRFQTSIIIKQDPQKAGVLSFLSQVEQTQPQRPTQSAPQTMRPSGGGGYN
jgi:hypothetical protein